MWARLAARALFTAAWLTMLGATITASFASTDDETVTLEQSIAYTLERNPDLVAFGYQLDSQRGRIQQAGLRPNPQLDLFVENAAGTGPFSGVESTETTLSLFWVLERGKRERRVDVTRAGLTLLESDAQIERLDAAAETARLYLVCLEDQGLLQQAEDAVRFAQQTVEAIRNRVQAGRTPAADLARAEVVLAERRLTLEEHEHELVTSLRRLAAQWGNTDPEFKRVQGDGTALPNPVSYERLRERVDQNPDLTRYLSERRVREAEVRLAESRAKPNWRVSAGVRHFEQTGDQALVAGITIPLTTRNRNEGRIAETRAALAMTDANRRAERVRIETTLFQVYQELQHSLHVATSLRDDILPRVERALRETERAYEAGRYGYLELRSAQDEALNARTAALVAAIDAHRNSIEIERLTGSAIAASAVR